MGNIPSNEKSLPSPLFQPTPKDNTMVLITWGEGGNDVAVCGSFNGWEKLTMVRSSKDITKEFQASVPLKPGTYMLKFVVDNEWRCSQQLPTTKDDQGNLVNFITVQEMDEINLFPAHVKEKKQNNEYTERPDSPVGNYSNEIPPYLRVLENPSLIAEPGLESPGQQYSLISRQVPPQVPAFLTKVILNTSTKEGKEPHVLQVPSHATLNHLFACSIKDGTMAVATTSRYRTKYVTSIYYKPVQLSQ
eukprot:NODE_80_length_22759_cov_1.466858.p11 type:complete len:247 gc:universal NODE_80_length_22759_cov_1.466858:19724-18984(-)